MVAETDIFAGWRAGQDLPPHRVERALAQLRALGASGKVVETLYVPAGADRRGDGAPAPIDDRRFSGWRAALETGRGRVLGSSTGIAAFRVDDVGLALTLPFPMDLARVSDGIDDRPLLELLAKDFTVGVALVRLGRYAVAVYQGRRLAVSKTDTRYVKSKHHAGGTSQRRFRRVRENQIHRLYAEASAVLERQWQPWVERLDYVALGGEAATVNGFVGECPLLSRLAGITLERRLDVREPNRKALDGVGAMLYQCRAYPLRML